MSNLANNGHPPVASVPLDARDGIRSTMQAAQWDQGLHMEALANLAHELRSPVQAILGYLDILRDELSKELVGRHRQIIDRMNANAHDLAQTVENVMDFSVSDAMAEASDEEEIHLHDLIGDLALVLDAANDLKGLEIRFELEGAPAVFRARRRPINAILLNLAINAIKFTDRGRVTIAIRLAQSSQLGSAVELEVRDTGPGIDSAMVAQAFTRCAQLSHSSIRTHRGMGLGLAVVQRNAEALGAKIIVKSELPQGSSFLVIVPLANSIGDAHPIRT
ncbi:sensor histidine kinase [Candidatus Binatus sp.]|uniref:sensor histidine kinase n=1 Tax=Candidatus Binatus sp. TaxID=2811406 RepID=UPI003CC50C01